MEGRGGAIVLVGFMATGKSAVGRELERRTGLARFDTDEMLAAAAGRSIVQIFDAQGEEEFRRRETMVLRDLPRRDAIVVTGGGAVLRDENVSLLRGLGIVVNLTADLQTLSKRIGGDDGRPLLRSADPQRTLAELFHVRERRYRESADFEIDTSALTIEEVAAAILTRMEVYRQNVS